MVNYPCNFGCDQVPSSIPTVLSFVLGNKPTKFIRFENQLPSYVSLTLVRLEGYRYFYLKNHRAYGDREVTGLTSPRLPGSSLQTCCHDEESRMRITFP